MWNISSSWTSPSKSHLRGPLFTTTSHHCQPVFSFLVNPCNRILHWTAVNYTVGTVAIFVLFILSNPLMLFFIILAAGTWTYLLYFRKVRTGVRFRLDTLSFFLGCSTYFNLTGACRRWRSSPYSTSANAWTRIVHSGNPTPSTSLNHATPTLILTLIMNRSLRVRV